MRIFAVIQICCLLAGSAAVAQPFTPTESEIRHNDAAIEFGSKRDYVQAIPEAKKAVDERGLNIFWLNLGRFQQHAELCEAAIESYTQALSAPAVVEPSRKIVRETVQRYMTELVEQCPARVKVTCFPDNMQVVARLTPATQDIASKDVACGSTVGFPGGSWTFVGTLGVSSATEVMQLRAAREYEVRLILEAPVAATPVPTTPVAPKPDATTQQPPIAAHAVVAPPPSKTLPLLGVLSGTLMLGTGLVLDVAPKSSHNGELDGVDFVPLGLYIGGIALIVLGVAAW